MKLTVKNVLECAATWTLGLVLSALLITFIALILWTLTQPFWWVGSHLIAIFFGIICAWNRPD